jgi:hypothetical protein
MLQKSISTSLRTWNAPKKDEKVGFSKESTSSDFTKGKEKGDQTSTS